ncbi:heavy metal-binding protein HIP-like isoform X2 [Mercenaria mercenaria]|uniref:heavy metal-binding protein HIP-like isoform X2 n=1 Tax=Mercenaria mercenaria TaxID=6596 RepID=UPI00234E49F5|nr:heavy metal-binding protein HIP-like isoform X2 [Mercenaria mercenaria]
MHQSNMLMLCLFVVFGLSINVCLLEEPCYNRCGCDFSVIKKLIKLEEEVETIKDALKEVTGSANCKNVAFRAQLTQDLGSVTLGQKIIYDSVELNLGNAFHPFHGVFTAPCDGIYLFSITIGNSNRSGVIHLKKNNVTIEYAWAGHNAGWDMGGVTTVVKLNAGDDVWVEGRGIIAGANSFDGIGARKHTAFSGTLLHAL